MIEIRNLTKLYGSTIAVDNISFEVKKGEILGLLGPNGAGKPTTMRVLTCFFPPTRGTALVGGFDCLRQPIEVKRIIGYMPENQLLYNEMTVEGTLIFICKLYDIPNNKIKTRINETLEKLDLNDVRKKIIGRLSKGYKQRVALGQAIIHDPEVLILDEPTTGLDPKQIIEVRELIKSFAEKKTVILSSHILPEVSQICEKIVIIDKGRIVAIDTQEELLRRIQGTERLIVEIKGDETKVLNEARSINGVKNVSNYKAQNGRISFTLDSEIGVDIREDIFKMAVKNNWVIYELRPVGMSLEDIFLRLTKEE